MAIVDGRDRGEQEVDSEVAGRVAAEVDAQVVVDAGDDADRLGEEDRALLADAAGEGAASDWPRIRYVKSLSNAKSTSAW